MASSKYYSFLNFLFFCLLLQKLILISAEVNCVNPQFKNTQPIVVDYFFSAESCGLSENFCPVVLNSNGLISVKFHMCSALEDKESCNQIDDCLHNRLYACYYKHFPDIYNDTCNQRLPPLDLVIADCGCQGLADKILTDNEAARQKYGIPTLPALVLNGQYDPCFTDYSRKGMKTYFCNAYKNALPICNM